MNKTVEMNVKKKQFGKLKVKGDLPFIDFKTETKQTVMSNYLVNNT